MKSRGWLETAAGHYRQALEAFADARWAGTNGPLRSMGIVEGHEPVAA